MKYRQAVTADIPAFCRIEQAQPRAAQWTFADWQSELNHPASYVLCAQDAVDLVGFVAVRLSAGVCEIVNVAVSPVYCRHGIGQALLSQAISWVRAHGGERVTLEVGVTNLPAVHLYKKVGFTQVGTRRKFYNGNEDALILGLTL